MQKILLLVLIFTVFRISSFSQVYAPDSTALANIYATNGGAGWPASYHWAGTPVTSWNGVILDGDGIRVIGLSLPAVGLTGSFPAASISALTALNFIDISDNPSLGGSLSSVVWPNGLEMIILANNNLTGAIPASLGGLTGLSVLKLANNQFTGVLPDFSGTDLVDVDISGNKIENIPAFPSFMYSLNLADNSIAGSIPNTVGSYTVLELLNLQSNNLDAAIPASFSNLTALTNLDLSNNNLSGGLPGYMATAYTNLTSLRLNSNQLTGSIPSGFGAIDGLGYLILNNNSLSGTIPSDLCSSVSNFDEIRLNNNQFTFSGLECLASSAVAGVLTYDHQKTLTIQQGNEELSVDAGGTMANNTYHWFHNNTAITPVTTGNNTLAITEEGVYRVEVTNSLATQLTLFSADFNVTALPLDWVSFAAQNCNDNACLEWKTDNEINTSRFEVERSINGGVTFTKITSNLAANTGGKHTYSYTDYAAAYGINFYRVKQLDLDGRFTYSKTVPVKITPTNILSITPNPASGFITVKGIEKAERVIIMSIAGQQLKQWHNVSGNQSLDISTLQNGFYLVKVLYNNTATVRKILKQ